MIQLTAQMRILVAVEPVDFRRGIDGLCRLCRQALATDPFSGAVFVFRSRSGTSVKILAYDGLKVPEFATFAKRRTTKRPDSLAYPLYVKSLTEEGSAGISGASIVNDDA